MARIVISEFMDAGAVELLRDNHDVDYRPGLVDAPDELRMAVGEADCLIVRNRTHVTAELLDSGPTIRVVGRLGVGLDNIDLGACESRAIAVRPAVGANAAAVAEYVIGAALVLLRGAFGSTEAMLDGRWPRTELTGCEAQGRTMGLVGYGSIAREVARRAVALGMNIVAHDPYLPAGAAWQPAQPLELAELLSISDVVSLHVPLLPETRHLIDSTAIDAMKPGALLINSARGGIVDEVALVAALVSGRLGGAALDVYEVEPPQPERLAEFATAPNLILTPHIAGVTQESNVRVSRMVAEAVLQELGDD